MKGAYAMDVRQIRTSTETRGLIEKLRNTYIQERFKDEQVTMTPGYILNAAWEEVKNTEDWNTIINSVIKVDDEFSSKVKETKTPVVRYSLSTNTSDGLNKLTKKFSDELGLRVQTGFTAKQIIKAAILLREEK